MLKGMLLSAVLGAAALFATGAQAAPVSPAAPAVSSGLVQQVAQGCGRGFHRGPAGGCRRNLSPAEGPCWWVRGPGGAWRLVCR